MTPEEFEKRAADFMWWLCDRKNGAAMDPKVAHAHLTALLRSVAEEALAESAARESALRGALESALAHEGHEEGACGCAWTERAREALAGRGEK